MVITVLKDSTTGSVSASIDSPATTLSAAPADVIAQQVYDLIISSLQ